jgi:hypothetical protein
VFLLYLPAEIDGFGLTIVHRKLLQPPGVCMKSQRHGQFEMGSKYLPVERILPGQLESRKIHSRISIYVDRELRDSSDNCFKGLPIPGLFSLSYLSAQSRSATSMYSFFRYSQHNCRCVSD